MINADRLKKVLVTMSKKTSGVLDILDISNAIELAPTIEERPHGEWIEHRQFNSLGCFYSEYECSNCHDEVWQKTEWQFCPNCGASMKAGEADDT